MVTQIVANLANPRPTTGWASRAGRAVVSICTANLTNLTNLSINSELYMYIPYGQYERAYIENSRAGRQVGHGIDF